MIPKLLRLGQSQSKVIILDQALHNLEDWRDLARAMHPFPQVEENAYPGIRRRFETRSQNPLDLKALSLTDDILNMAAPYIGGAFETTGFDLKEASFSMVTREASALLPPQRSPHFDETDPKLLALLVYLSPTANTGTAFFRHRATGLEVITQDQLKPFVDQARIENSATEARYIAGSNPYYEQIGSVEAIAGRLVCYQGALLHSGIIPDHMPLSSDPDQGRLTLNIFIKLH